MAVIIYEAPLLHALLFLLRRLPLQLCMKTVTIETILKQNYNVFDKWNTLLYHAAMYQISNEIFVQYVP